MAVYRDRLKAGAHDVIAAGVCLTFDADGLLRDPTPEQVKELASRGRFELVVEQQTTAEPKTAAAPETAPVVSEWDEV